MGFPTEYYLNLEKTRSWSSCAVESGQSPLFSPFVTRGAAAQNKGVERRIFFILAALKPDFIFRLLFAALIV